MERISRWRRVRFAPLRIVVLLVSVVALLTGSGGGIRSSASAAAPNVTLAILHFSVIKGTTWSGAHDRAGQRIAQKYPNVKYVFREEVGPDLTIPYAEELIRQGAINRQILIDNVLQANQQPAMAAVPPTMGLNTGGYFKDNDQETANKLLEEGMKELGISKLPPIKLSYNTSEGHKKIAEAIQDQWRQNLGAEVKLENQEWKVYLETMHEGNYQVGRLGWSGDFNDPINFLELFKEKDGGNNDTRWENPRFKELLNQSATESDPEKRKAILREAEQIMMDEMPIMPIYFYTHTWVKNDKVKGIFQDGLGAIDWKWASIE